ncbi:MAG: hypothetical protein AB1Z98_06740 [Nannocystaceae bacterium]
MLGDPSLLRRAKLHDQDIAMRTLGGPSAISEQMRRLEEKQKSWTQRFMIGRNMSKVLEDIRVKEIRDWAEYQRAVFRIATDAKLEMAHTVCLSLTRELKVATQERFTSLIMDKQEHLRRNVIRKRENFLEDMDATARTIMNYAHMPWLAERAMQSLHLEAAQYFDWIEALLSDFISISSQRLSEYNTRADRGNSGSGSSWG